MALKKITEEEMNAQGVIAAPDILNGTPAQNKAIFDRMVRNLVAPAVNACAEAVDEVNANQEEWGKQEQTRETNEGDRKTAEARRVEAEVTRETNEAARKQAEGNRSLAEEQRTAAEQARREAEAIRQAKEKERDNAEQGRAADEATRRDSEAYRVEAENARNLNEAERKRVEALRVEVDSMRETAEVARQQAEQERKTAESRRVENEEKRKAQENARVEAEQRRVDTDNGIVAQATEAAKRAEDSAKEVMQAAKPPYIGKNGNWFVWDDEAAAFVDSGTRATGDKPVAGTDYWTQKDKEEIAKEAAELVDVPEVVQETGESEATVMSQKAVTNALGYPPNYWINELETKADSIQQAMEAAGSNKSAFLWYTDAHWPLSAKMSPVLLDYLCKNTSINKVNFGGDIVGDPSPYDHENIKYVYDWRKRIAGLPNHHSVYGNHDVNHWTTDVHKIAYALLIAPEESAEMVVGGDSYYYIDNPSEKTRYLYLSYLTKSSTEMLAQGQFIVDALKGTPEGWHIVAIAHRWWQYSSSATPTVGSVPAYETDILSVFDAYNARKTRGGSNYFYAQDFTEAKGRVEFCIGGHIHVDYDFESDGGIPVIITAADTNQERSPNDTEDSGTIGTTTESAVFGIIADYTDTNSVKITVVGVGRGTSRVVRGSAMKLTSISNITYSGDTTVGATIDKSKFSFKATYSNGTTATITGATSVNPATIGVVGNNSVTVTYTEGTVTVTETATIVGTAAPVVRLLSLDRTYVSGTAGELVANNLDVSKAYLNAPYSVNEFNASSCTVSDVTEDSVTVKESGVGGVCVAYPVYLPDLPNKAYKLTFDYSGAGKCRTYYRYAIDGALATSNQLFINDTAGASGSAEAVIPLSTDKYQWVIIYFTSNTGNTKAYTNVSLTEAE